MNSTTFCPLPHVEIDLDALCCNYRSVAALAGKGNRVMCVVKDNAYGCGSVPVAAALQRAGAENFVVASTTEALGLRAAGITGAILVLGQATPDEYRQGSREQLCFALNSLESLALLRAQASPVSLHVNVDTGMGRLGLSPTQVAQAAQSIASAPHLSCSGIFTHFACADEPDQSSMLGQLRLFKEAVRVVQDNGLAPGMIHADNSAATVYGQVDSFFTHIRPGIVLYGCAPDPQRSCPMELAPVVSLGGPVVMVKKIARGTTVSYGSTYRAPRDTMLATVALGYAHGVPRSLSSCGELLLGGKRCPIAGRVTMDYCMVDTGPDSSAMVGDRACLFGRQGDLSVSVDSVAMRVGTIGYELLCRMSRSIDRVYLANGAPVQRIAGLPF